MVRVRIDSLRSAASRLSFDHPSGSLQVGSAKISTPFSLRLEEGSWIINPSGGKELEFPALQPLLIEPARAASGIVQYQGVDWPGRVEVVAVSDEGAHAMDVVVQVLMETYLPGVIAKEMYHSWDDDAFEAQAIAARSYAVVEHERWRDRRHYDLVAGQASQAWVGATTHPRSVKAVAATRGQLLMFEDRVVPAYYSSCCGGHPANAAECVTENPNHNIAPLRAGDAAVRHNCCGSAKVARWTATITSAEVVRALSQITSPSMVSGDFRGLSGLSSIEVQRRNQSGRATEFRIRDNKGKIASLGAEDLRRALASVKGGPLKSGDFTVHISSGKCRFDGRGFGHGSGMCQHGAQAMALTGSSEVAILQRYYPHARLVTAWH
ncbi:MAG: SpoIID/LytB domain-containing protein [Phycisphaerales bacterium]|nr:SpoIID/LytB domain-containing protein [Phycisphaerales bacterium]